MSTIREGTGPSGSRAAAAAAGRRICLVTQWFPPEQAPIGHIVRELALALARAGWKVSVLTGFPNHPGGAVFGGYRKRWFLEERMDGVRVWRVWLHTSPRRTRLSRVLTFLTFTLTSSLALLVRSRPTVIFAVLQPLSVGVVLPVLARLKGARLVFNVQDLHPDVPIELGLVRNLFVIRVLRAVESWAYRKSDAITAISEGFRRHILARGERQDGVHVIENWIDLDEVRPQDRLTNFRRQLGCAVDDFLVLFAGTVGLMSGAEVLLDAARELGDDPRVRLVIVGDGPLLARLRERAEREGLARVVFAPFQPRDRLAEVQASADISLVTMLPGKGRLSVPSKVLGYMAAARPVIAAVDVDSETARLVRESGAGLVVAPGDGRVLADAIRALQRDAAGRGRMGEAGRTFLERHFAKDAVLARYARVLEEVAHGA